jgi:hypothetical protein
MQLSSSNRSMENSGEAGDGWYRRDGPTLADREPENPVEQRTFVKQSGL